MTLNEFKAWFEGFNENLDGVPNRRQWDRIVEKVAALGEPSRLIGQGYAPPTPAGHPFPNQNIGAQNLHNMQILQDQQRRSLINGD